MSEAAPFVWREVIFPRPLSEEAALEAMRRLADDPSEPVVVLEARATSERTQYLVGCDAQVLPRVAAALGVTIGDEGPERATVATARSLRLSSVRRGFGQDRLELSSVGLLSALHRVRRGELLVVQVVIGARRRAASVSPGSTAPQSLGALLSGAPARRLDRDEFDSLTRKVSQPGFRTSVRLGVSADTAERRRMLLLDVFGALRRLESAGLHLRLSAQRPSHVDAGHAGWRLPLPLSIREAAATIPLPVGDGALPGLPPVHPKSLAPTWPLAQATRGRVVIGKPTTPGVSGVLTVSVDAVLRGLHMIGPPGVGKSDLAGSIAVQWINQGNAAVVLEPKTDLADSIVSRIDERERHRIVYVDLTADHVIGFNPLRLNGRPPEVVADGILTVFGSIFSDVLGVRTKDIVYAAVLTLVQYPGATLVMLPRLLSDAAFRRTIVAAVSDDPVLAGFWAWFDSLSEQAISQAVTPILSRLRQVLLRRSLRSALGQADPKFDVREVFGAEKKVLIVPLAEAHLGKEGAALFGSLLLHEVFSAVKDRAAVEPKRRHPVAVIVDEFQTYLRAEEGFREALAVFRGYGCGLILANQLFAQLPSELRSVVLGAVRSRVYFQLSPEDAHALSRWTNDLDAADFLALEPFHIYSSLYEHGMSRPFVSGRTLKLPEPSTRAQTVKDVSARRYGRPVAEIEAEFARLSGVGENPASAAPASTTAPDEIGRRRRRTTNE